MKISDFRSIFFDCDGVILDSNNIKTEAFKYVSRRFGLKASSSLVKYHLQNGGVSRYEKFNFFIEKILPNTNPNFLIKNKENTLRELVENFSKFLHLKLLKCNIANNLYELRNSTPDTKWFIVSGSDQSELRHLFAKRNINDYFDGGIFGSPNSKAEIMNNLIISKKIALPALFIGDSMLDHKISKKFNLSFYFMSNWSDFYEYKEYCSLEKIPVFKSISDLVPKKNIEI